MHFTSVDPTIRVVKWVWFRSGPVKEGATKAASFDCSLFSQRDYITSKNARYVVDVCCSRSWRELMESMLDFQPEIRRKDTHLLPVTADWFPKCHTFPVAQPDSTVENLNISLKTSPSRIGV